MPTDADGFLIARSRITTEQEKRSGVLDLGNLGLTEWPEDLWELSHLTCLNLGVGWTDEKGGFHFAEPGAAYAPNRLSPAEAAASWARLPHLQVLSLAGPRGDGSAWGDLVGLENLTRLRVLDLSWTEVGDLAPLAGLTQLEVLDASYTFVSSLGPLTRLTALRHLDLSYTDVGDLSALQGHAALQNLLCYHAPVVSVVPLAGLVSLRKLDLTQTRVTALDSLVGLSALQALYCAWTPIEKISESLVRLPSLKTLVLHENSISNVPVEVLSPEGSTSCLEQVRAYFDSSAARSHEVL